VNERLRECLKDARFAYPHELEAQFPRLVEKIVATWNTPAEATALFEDLLVDQRGDRQGVPPEVAREIFLLSVVYDKLRRAQDGADAWAHERMVAQATLHELGLRLIPADMLRAAEGGDPERLQLFIRAGMAVDTRDARAWTPLMAAAFHGNEAAARLLIEHNADAQTRERGGYTALHWAALRGHEQVVALVLPRVGADVQSTAGLTPLFQAAGAGHVAAVSVLLESGANPNLGTAERWTPLHKAAQNGHAKVVQLLLSAGASVFARNVKGESPATLAETSRHEEILRMLRSSSPAGMF
jgi:hypothetical protein